MSKRSFRPFRGVRVPAQSWYGDTGTTGRPHPAPRHWTPEELEASRSRYYQYGERNPIMGVRGRDWDYPEAKGA